MTYRQDKNISNSQLENQSFEGYQFTWFDWFCLWYPPGWLILFNRHWQYYHQDPDGWNWLEYALFLIPGGFYLALLIRWLRLGFRSPRSQVDEFDPNYQQAFQEEVIQPIVKYYFRAELQHLENLPETAPLIVAMNHAGMCFPWDFITLGYLLRKTRGWAVKSVAGLSLFDHPWMIWWLPPGWSKVLGAVRAELHDFEATIQENKVILYAPEGLRGPRKGWSKRYQLEKFDVSFIKLSQRYKVSILPIICIGNENLHPWTINFKSIQSKLNLPFLPISPLMIFFILFPSMGVWAMRTKLNYFIQPVKTSDIKLKLPGKLTRKRALFYQQAQIIREQMQNQINQYLKLKL